MMKILVASASKDGRQPNGNTTWDAIRIIETGNGLYLDVTDFTFATFEGVQEYYSFSPSLFNAKSTIVSL